MKNHIFIIEYRDTGRKKKPSYPNSFKKGEFYTSKRLCGVEIESVKSNSINLTKIQNIIPTKDWVLKNIGNLYERSTIDDDFIEQDIERSNDFYKRLREVDYNVSYSQDAGGIEIQTPAVSGKKFEENILGFCDILNEYKFKGTNSCGGHIHLDLNLDYDIDKLVRLADFYIGFENWIYKVLPEWRRKSSWCNPILKDKSSILQSIKEIKKEEDNKLNLFSTTWNQKVGCGKYYGFNLNFYLNSNANRHLELRYLEGTTNPYDFIHWASVHSSALDFVSKNSESINGRKLLDEITDAMQRNKTFYFHNRTILNELGVHKETVKHFIKRYLKFKLTNNK